MAAFPRFAHRWKAVHPRHLVHATGKCCRSKGRLLVGARVDSMMVAAKTVALLAAALLLSTALARQLNHRRCRRLRNRRPRRPHSPGMPKATVAEKETAATALKRRRTAKTTLMTGPHPSRSGIARRPPSPGSPAQACLGVERDESERCEQPSWPTRSGPTYRAARGRACIWVRGWRCMPSWPVSKHSSTAMVRDG